MRTVPSCCVVKNVEAEKGRNVILYTMWSFDSNSEILCGDDRTSTHLTWPSIPKDKEPERDHEPPHEANLVPVETNCESAVPGTKRAEKMLRTCSVVTDWRSL